MLAFFPLNQLMLLLYIETVSVLPAGLPPLLPLLLLLLLPPPPSPTACQPAVQSAPAAESPPAACLLGRQSGAPWSALASCPPPDPPVLSPPFLGKNWSDFPSARLDRLHWHSSSLADHPSLWQDWDCPSSTRRSSALPSPRKQLTLCPAVAPW